MHSQRYSRGVLPTYFSIQSARLRRKFGEEIGNGEKGHLAATSENDPKHLLPTAKPTPAAIAVDAVRPTPATTVCTAAAAAAMFCFEGGHGRGNDGEKYPDTSVFITGRWNEPLSTTVRLLTGVRIRRNHFFARRFCFWDATR